MGEVCFQRICVPAFDTGFDANAGVADGGISDSGTDIVQTPANLSLEGIGSIDFVTVTSGAVASKTIRIINTGERPAQKVAFQDPALPFAVTQDNCGETVFTSCEMTLTFSPEGFQAYTDTLGVSYYDGVQDTATFFALYGKGITSASLAISRADGDSDYFGRVLLRDRKNRRYVVTNGGETPATDISPGPFGSSFGFEGGNYPGTNGYCGDLITVDCFVSLTFSPQISGRINDELQLNYFNGVAQATATLAVSGNGTEYGWTRTMGASALDLSMGKDILADSLQNIYVVGHFMGTVDFNPAGTQDLKTSQGEEDIFITRINSDGSYGWTKTIGGTSNDWGFGLAQNTAGQLYIVGGYNSSMNFDFSGGSDYHSARANGGIFITQFSPNGTYGWTRTFGTNYTGSLFPRAFDIAIDAADSIYLTGYFYGSNINFAPGVSYSSKNNGSTFVTKLDSDGSHIWTDKFSGNGPYNCYVHPPAIAFDNNGNIFVTGSFSGSLIPFYGAGAILELSSNANSYDIYITKIRSDHYYEWTVAIGGPGEDHGYGITTDDQGNVFVTGSFKGTVDFNPNGPPEPREAVGDSDIFVLKIDAFGGFIWVFTDGNEESFSEARNIVGDNWGNFIITGTFGGNIGILRLNSAGSAPTFRPVAESAGYGYGVYVDAYHQVYLTGCFVGTANFDFTKETNDIHSSQSFLDIWIMKMAL